MAAGGRSRIRKFCEPFCAEQVIFLQFFLLFSVKMCFSFNSQHNWENLKTIDFEGVQLSSMRTWANTFQVELGESPLLLWRSTAWKNIDDIDRNDQAEKMMIYVRRTE